MITFGGVSSDEVRLIVQHWPSRIIPTRKYSTAAVPGRSGDLLDMQDAWEPYSQSYSVFLRGGRRGDVPVLARAAAQWLMSKNGYQRLEDSYEPNCYRLAAYVGPLDIENRLGRYGTATLSFLCGPQRFLLEGENPITLAASGDALLNPTVFPARPLLKITSSGAGTITVGDITISIVGTAAFSPLCIDCSTGEAYTVSSAGFKINRNTCISGLGLPELPAGETAISWTGGVSAVEVVPRWWTL